MKKTLFWVLATFCCPAFLSGQLYDSERQALVTFYEKTGGSGWLIKDNWLGPPGSEANWYGVFLDEDGRHVTELYLPNNQLTGKVPAELAGLPYLRMLSLSGNSLAGPLPPALGGLIRLESLEMSDNLLTGPLPPELSTCQRLSLLNLSNNQLDGPLPPEWKILARLELLILSGNQLSGPLPSAWGSLAGLIELRLEYNQLSGSIPASFGNLSSMQHMALTGNQLEGGIPASFGQLAQLQSLCLSNNHFTGSLPAPLCKLPQLRQLFLQHNELTGPLPAEIGQLALLEILDLYSNELTGPLPVTLGDLTRLTSLDLSSNRFDGELPPALGRLPALQYLSLGFNRLTGRLPEALGQLAALEWLALQSNYFTGPVPAGIASLHQLKGLYLGGNWFTGAIPPEFCNLLNLEEMDLSSNQLDGPLPPGLGCLASLKTLNLGGNQLAGEIPESFGQLSQLLWLNLTGNQLTGPLPASLSQLQQLKTLSIAWNQLSGGLPPSFSTLAGLETLDLESNRLEGPLPAWLGQLQAMSWLNLAENLFSGPPPAELAGLPALNYLWLYGNQLQGPLPAAWSQLQNLQSGIGLDISWNSLYTDDQALSSFLNEKHWGDDFETTQTAPPLNLRVVEAGNGMVRLEWDPVRFQASEGGYELYARPAGSNQPVLRESIPDKTVTGYRDCLCPPGAYEFMIRSFTLPHGMNPSRLTSDFSPAVAAGSQVDAAGTIRIHHQPDHTGVIYPGSPSQILPASYLTFQIGPGAGAGASSSNPLVIKISFPARAFLGQSLSDGNPDTAAPLPEADEYVMRLAVSEYRLDEKGRPQPTGNMEPVSSISPDAVQLLRYVEGERSLLLRINESTANWLPSAPERFIGFTIGQGGGSWPPDGASNWGPEGFQMQDSTLFWGDLRSFPVDPDHPEFTVNVCAFYQFSGQAAAVEFLPSNPVLFTAGELRPGVLPASSRLGGTCTDFALVDLNGDGREDILSLDAATRRLYWSLSRPEGGFQLEDYRELAFVNPVTVDAADLDGDGRPEILIADDTAGLTTLTLEELFNPVAASTRTVYSKVRLPLAGTPSDARAADISGDGKLDYLYTDASANSLTVLLDLDTAHPLLYPTGASPRALAIGDFNGDTSPDVAVANTNSGSISVFLNNGRGGFTGAELAGVGLQPADLDTGDFNRDGRADLGLALAGDKAVGALLAGPDGQFTLPVQKIYTIDTPSAIQVENFDGENGADALLGFSDHHELNLYRSTPAGPLEFSHVIDTLGDVTVDPLTGQVTLQADKVLTVASGTSYGGVSSRQGVAVIQQQGFGVLHYPRSQDISFSVVNLGSRDALINLELYSDGLGQPVKTSSWPVAPGTQFARYLASLLGSEAEQPGRWVRGFTTSAGMYGFWLVNRGSSLNYLDGVRTGDVRQARTRLWFPVAWTGSGRQTSLIIINPNRDQSRVSLKRMNSQGIQQGPAWPVLLTGRGRAVLDAATLFPGLAEGDYIQLVADRAVLGVELFGDAGSVAALEAQESPAGSPALFCPHLASGNFGVTYYSRLVLINSSTEAAAPVINYFNDSGELQQAKSVNLAAGEKSVLDLALFFGLTGAATGHLRIDPGGSSGLSGCIIFGETGAGRFLSSLPLQEAGHNRYLLGHIANGTIGGVNFFTGVAVLHAEENPEIEVPVRVTAYDQTGRLLETRIILLAGRQRKVFLLDQFMPRLTTLFGGYLLVENLNYSAGIQVFEMFGDTALQFLSAVPAIPLD